ncbi:hypothetical protein Patl1_16616 [Pistacia atlantica]|uniref:Uncharacterized protein n=1 Tax=Pistacia atlantica TaxID=434234 RepID=A0ACC1B8S8_9ROSI|nr:hypothetical protein Patl1_16616 [Pistacia atlantica]
MTAKPYVAERVAPNLVRMKQVLYRSWTEEMFNRGIYNEPMNSKGEAAAILANILESGIEYENLQVSTQGHKMTSDYVLYNLIYMLKNSTPDELNVSLIRILLCLSNSPKSMATIVSVIKDSEASYSLISFINNPHEELGVATIKLLITISPYMGHTLVERLCKTRGQPENLIQCPTETARITQKQAISAKFLAKLPHQNLTLNLALVGKNVVPTVLQSINLIQRSGTRTKQRLSAIGLENLSSESTNLSKPPEIKKTKFLKVLTLPKSLSFSSSKKKIPSVCPVHRGACSSQNTFCLIDAKAVGRLLACLAHENVEVVEAALSALCTLLDDKVDVHKSVSMLSEVNTIQHVLNVVKEHREEGLWQKSFWMIDRFLMKGGDKHASDISQDRLLPATLVSAFHHGDINTRQMAEKILRHLNKMPNIYASNYTM